MLLWGNISFRRGISRCFVEIFDTRLAFATAGIAVRFVVTDDRNAYYSIV